MLKEKERRKIMKKPKNWSLNTADTMVFNVFVFCGFNKFNHYEDPWVVKSFNELVKNANSINEFRRKIYKESIDGTPIGRILNYVPNSFLHLLFLNLKHKEKGTVITPKELVGTWERYLNFLKYVHREEVKARQKKEEKWLTPEQIITMAKNLLTAIHKKDPDMYNPEKIDYFCYLSEDYLKLLRGSLEN